ncbi:MAG: prepilin peptidase [Rhodobacteraceae bacterium CG17_big_fil_post_rev_8_21_14_2_50_63_15]|nr:prepilin peptidase [Roseovarius sp.]PIV78250.1 MAG: prepilin peptidase [Rhodobacteraceae bacterium CG17_big_fil_post_rev_8_21_14_2_50_63_15]
MTETSLLAVFLILCGAVAGSFLAAWADRLPRAESIVHPPSRCRTCDTRIGWHDLVPVASWLWLGGRCRTCGAEIPRRLFYAEIGGMGLAILAVWGAQSPWHMVLGAFWLWLLMGLMMCDLAALRLPDALTGLLFLTGLGLAWEDPLRSVGDGVIGAALGAGAFWLIRICYRLLRKREGLGLGDVKLMAGIGAGLGVMPLPIVALIGATSALIWSGLTSWQSGHQPDAALEVPFGAHLAGASALLWLIL